MRAPGRRGLPLALAGAILVAACGGVHTGGIPSNNPGSQSCLTGPMHLPFSTPAASTGIVEYKVPGLIGVEKIVPGPDGNLWFTGGSFDSAFIGRITTGGKITLYPLKTQSGGFDGITEGPDGNIWFTESTAVKIGRLIPSTGHIDEFTLQLPPTPPSAQPRNTQARDLVAGPDGNLWFDVQQVAAEPMMPTGYVGRVTPAGVSTLFAIPGGDQPVGIQVGADGNLWSRIAVADSASVCAGIQGYSPTARVVRVTPNGAVTELNEDSPQFAGDLVGPDGNHWWMTSSAMIRRTTPAGQVTNFPSMTNLGFWDAFHVVFGPDRDLWYLDGSNVLRMSPAGEVTKYHAPGTNSGATWITSGPDGRLWFTEGASGAATIGAIRPTGG
jgi:streptogramin lyase